MIFCVQQMIEKSCEQQQPLHVAFIDLTKAFDLVDRKKIEDRESLFTVLLKAGCPPMLLTLVKCFHRGMEGKVQYNGDVSKSLEGFKQVCVLAPTLFDIYFAYLFRTAFQNIANNFGVSLLTRDDGNSLYLDSKPKQEFRRLSFVRFSMQIMPPCCPLYLFSCKNS